MKVNWDHYRFYRCSNKCGKSRQSGNILHFGDVQKNLEILSEARIF